MSGERTRRATSRAKPKLPRPRATTPRPRRRAVLSEPVFIPVYPTPFRPVPIPPMPEARERVEASWSPLMRYGPPALLFLVALAVLGAELDEPAGIIFDEAHYIHWSREIARGNLFAEGTRIAQSPVNFEHPPLAKHAMAASLRLFGAGQLDLSWPQYEKGCQEANANCSPGREWAGCSQPRPECRSEAIAWRLPSLLAGASAVPALYLLALRLFNSVPAGLFAATLLLLDTLWYLHSRLAMLDVFPAAFVLWGFAFLLGRGRAAPLLAGLAFGAGLASKYTAIFLLPVFLLAQYARTPAGSPVRRTLTTLAYGAALPFLVFVASYLPYATHWVAAGGVGSAAQKFVYVQIAAFSWDFGGTFTHPSASRPWAWIPHLNPTFYYWPGYDQFTRDNVLRPPFMYAVGNVVLWWPTTLALLGVPFAQVAGWIRRRARLYLQSDVLRALPRLGFSLSPTRSLLVAALLFFASFLPWFLLHRTTFNYYATFNVPFFALFAAGLLHFAWRAGPRGRAATVAYLTLAAAWFTAWWPIVSGAPVSRHHFEAVWNFVPWMSR